MPEMLPQKECSLPPHCPARAMFGATRHWATTLAAGGAKSSSFEGSLQEIPALNAEIDRTCVSQLEQAGKSYVPALQRLANAFDDRVLMSLRQGRTHFAAPCPGNHEEHLEGSPDPYVACVERAHSADPACLRGAGRVLA